MLFCVIICFAVVAAVTYGEEAIEVGEIKSVGNLGQDVQGQLSLMGRFTALIRCAPQGRHVMRVQ